MTSTAKLPWNYDKWTTFPSSPDDEHFVQAIESLRAPTKLLHTENYVECIKNGLRRLNHTLKNNPKASEQHARFWQGILKSMPKTCQGELESVARRLENMSACAHQPVMYIEWHQRMYHLKGANYSRHISETSALRYFDPFTSGVQTLKWRYENKQGPLILPDMHYAKPWMKPFMEYLTSKFPQQQPMRDWARSAETDVSDLNRITKYLALYQTGQSMSVECLNATLFKVFVEKQTAPGQRLKEFKFFDTILYAMSYSQENKQVFLDGVTPLLKLWDRTNHSNIPSWVMAQRHYTSDMQPISPTEVWATQAIEIQKQQLADALVYLLINLVSDKKELAQKMIPLLRQFQPWSPEAINTIANVATVRSQASVQSVAQSTLLITQAPWNYELLEAFDPRVAVAHSMSDKNWFSVWKDMVDTTANTVMPLPAGLEDSMHI